MAPSFSIRIAATARDFDQGRILFQEYVDQLGVDLSFQHVPAELETIDRQYSSPDGALLLLYYNSEIAGCTGIRRLEREITELKRMYIRPAFRGAGLGAKLLQSAIDRARALGYKKIRLDTLADMHAAQTLYRSFGFYIIPPYCYNPLEGTIYMELRL